MRAVSETFVLETLGVIEEIHELGNTRFTVKSQSFEENCFDKQPLVD